MHAIAAKRLCRYWAFVGVVLALTVLGLADRAAAQRGQVTTQTPFRSVNDSFSERIGFGGNFSGPGFNVNLGGFPLAIPQFGGFQPGAGAVGGFGFRGGGFSGNVGFEFSQGSRRSNVMQAPIVTGFNGVPAAVQDLTISPFVISGKRRLPWKDQFKGYVPMRRSARAAAGQAPKTLGEAIVQREHSADGDEPIRSVADIRRNQQATEAAQNQSVKKYIERAQRAEKEGKLGVAKIYYRLAANNATGELKQRLLQRLSSLSD